MNNGPQREQILTLESECVILFRNRVFADVITLKDLFKKKMGILSWMIGVDPMRSHEPLRNRGHRRHDYRGR